ncbi:SDR family oxidoreductase [Rhizorhabdus sp. FW153]|uniref:SDR family oxidoreductase n=1 Tax=Rhizorhabdus sp. FW153 TaxID=3400216 RepID=UPI003CF8D945
MTRTLLVLGASSDIAAATARRFSAAGYAVQLAGRDEAALGAMAADLELRHRVAVSIHRCDVTEARDRAALLAGLSVLPDVVVCAVGLLGDQRESEIDPTAAERVMRANYEGPALLLGALAEAFASRGQGVIVGISSVAGERGRASNYVYGSAKAGMTAFLSGLRNRFGKTGVHVVSVLPGFVDTRMTEGMALPPALTARPEEVAQAIWRAVERKTDVVYVRPLWRWIMAIIRAIPEGLFKKLSI